METAHLAIAVTVAVHLALAVVIDAIGLTSKSKPKPKPPTVSLVDIDVAALRPPPPPPEPDLPPIPTPPAEVVQPTTPPPTRAPTSRRVATSPTTPRTNEPPPTSSEPPTSGGGDGEVYRLPSLGAEGSGPAVARGQVPSGRTGRGGSGGGSGSGDGAGSGSGVEPRPVSVAAIKTPAKPKGDFDYFDAGKDYPAEARALAIEGTIKAKLVVDDQGKVTKVTLINKLGHGLDELAVRRGRALQFTPALDDQDRAVSSIVVWEFTFTLPS